MTANNGCANLTLAGFPTGEHSGTQSQEHLPHKAAGFPAQHVAPVHWPHGTMPSQKDNHPYSSVLNSSWVYFGKKGLLRIYIPWKCWNNLRHQEANTCKERVERQFPSLFITEAFSLWSVSNDGQSENRRNKTYITLSKPGNALEFPKQKLSFARKEDILRHPPWQPGTGLASPGMATSFFLSAIRLSWRKQKYQLSHSKHYDNFNAIDYHIHISNSHYSQFNHITLPVSKIPKYFL